MLGNFKIYRKCASLTMYLQKDFHQSLKVGFFDSPNFGDALNPILLKLLGVKKVAHIATEFYRKENLQCIGSVLQVSNEGSTVWGSGFIGKDSVFFYAPPKNVLAVRGPLTRQKLSELNVPCPEVYGDPALLLPGLYKPEVAKKYDVGVVLHYSEKEKYSKQFIGESVLLIDVMDYNALKVVDHILSCKKIISSSLHGIIIAQAYGIPTYWIKISQIGYDDFKFHDFFQSVGIMEPRYINAKTKSVDDILQNISLPPLNYDPRPLIDSFPYPVDDTLKQNIIDAYES